VTFLLEARDLSLYKSITDNGAGGLASSVGEMATKSNGCEVDLEKAPLKYQGLSPWEILLSEAQERMTVGVDPTKVDAFLELARRRDVEATVLGRFTDSGKFHMKYGDKTVTYLDLEFLHEGVPQKELVAVRKQPSYDEPEIKQPSDLTQILREMLERLNVCSIEKKLRQYDHEVKGLSIIKPLVGKDRRPAAAQTRYDPRRLIQGPHAVAVGVEDYRFREFGCQVSYEMLCLLVLGNAGAHSQRIASLREGEKILLRQKARPL
jgi:phosphoribosylformylglycinamidine synthase